jgi:hypothetical protein
MMSRTLGARVVIHLDNGICDGFAGIVGVPNEMVIRQQKYRERFTAELLRRAQRAPI